MNTSQRLRSALKGMAPALTLVTTFGAAAWLYFGGDQRGRIVGFAQALPEAVEPIERARVVSVNVTVGEEVTQGQVIATLDTSLLDTQIRIAEAKKWRLEAERHAEVTLLQQQLDVGVETLERKLAEEREQQLQVTNEATALDGEMSRIKQLIESRQAVLDDLTKLSLQQATVNALASEKPRTLSLLGSQIKAAEQRRQDVKDGTSPMVTRLDAELRVAREDIDLLEKRRSGYVLHAAHGGRVVSLDKQPGELTAPGDPVAHTVSIRDRVVACVPERFGFGIREGDTAKLWIRGQLGAPLSGKTVALGPLVSELPIRCWPEPKMPIWGREVIVALDQPMELVPGQAFDITFSSNHSANAKAAPVASAASIAPATSLAASAPGPALMKVPPALMQRTRFEPSGLLTRPSESRYLIVSDDTGYDGNNEGAPWLFAMSPSGAVDPEPIPVSGVSAIDDLEAITAGDEGEVYVLSSQSYSRKGRRKPARTALLRLRSEGRGFRVDGEVHLAELLDAAPARAAALGLPEGTRALDIEGLSFHQGALYLGLKAPLDAHGNAMIWRIGAPAAFFRAEPSRPSIGKASLARLDEAELALWGRARVDVELSGQRTPGGISDLRFMPDGSLAVTSTPSTAEGAAGALWRVDQPKSGELSPRLLQRFPGFKPEGIAPSLSPGKLMIVFDAGSATPSFQEVPWGT